MRLPPLKQVAQTLRANRALGQNFLLDQGLCDYIARAVPLDTPILEIGPGPGGLTRALLNRGNKVTAIDSDPRMIAALQPLTQHYPEQLSLRCADALQVALEEYPAPLHIVGNLPFNVATSLLLHWLPDSLRIRTMVLMFQKEVAERLTATPNSKAYGRLGILAQFLMCIEPYCSVSAAAFTPAPKVDACVLRFTPRDDLQQRLPDFARLDDLLKATFAQRRKTLGRSLKGRIAAHLAHLEMAEIDPRRRAETLTEAEFLRLLAATKTIQAQSTVNGYSK